MSALCKPSLGTNGYLIKNLQAENGQKVDKFERYTSVITDTDKKWFVVFERTVNDLFFSYICLPQLECYFFSFFLFPYFFFFFCRYLILNR